MGQWAKYGVSEKRNDRKTIGQTVSRGGMYVGFDPMAGEVKLLYVDNCGRYAIQRGRAAIVHDVEVVDRQAPGAIAPCHHDALKQVQRVQPDGQLDDADDYAAMLKLLGECQQDAWLEQASAQGMPAVERIRTLLRQGKASHRPAPQLAQFPVLDAQANDDAPVRPDLQPNPSPLEPQPPAPAAAEPTPLNHDPQSDVESSDGSLDQAGQEPAVVLVHPKLPEHAAHGADVEHPLDSLQGLGDSACIACAGADQPKDATPDDGTRVGEQSDPSGSWDATMRRLLAQEAAKADTKHGAVPRSSVAALEQPEWRDSFFGEVDRFQRFKTVSQAVRLAEVPKNKTLLRLLVHFSRKTNGKAKTRIVVNGSRERPGMDYDDSRPLDLGQPDLRGTAYFRGTRSRP